MVVLGSLLNNESAVLFNMTHGIEWEKYNRRAREVCLKRSLFITSDEPIGLGPMSARAEDEECVLLGCDSTMLLHPVRNSLHQVVGQSFISRWNTGEALFGPLPENLREVNYCDSAARIKYLTLCERMRD